jgi:hypothetical protein
LSGWRLTIRHGSEVERERLDSLDAAIAELERRGEEIRAERPLDDVKMIREYPGADRVHARLEVSGPGLLRRPEAGLDVMGDGRLVPYRGTVFKKQLDPARGQNAYDAVREALRGER